MFCAAAWRGPVPHSQNDAFRLGDVLVEGKNVYENEKTAFKEKIEDIYEVAFICVSDIYDPVEKQIADQFNIVYISSKKIYFLYCRNSL